MIIAIPSLLFPLATAIVLTSGGTPLTPVEQTIDELPAASLAHADSQDVSPLGADGTRLAPGAAMPLYADSARATSTVLALRESEQARKGADRDYTIAEFSLLHPDERARDNFLIGDLGLVYDNPTGMDLSARLFKEYCSAGPSDSFYNLSIAALPINPALQAAVISWQMLPGVSSRCPSVTG